MARSAEVQENKEQRLNEKKEQEQELLEAERQALKTSRWVLVPSVLTSSHCPVQIQKTLFFLSWQTNSIEHRLNF